MKHKVRVTVIDKKIYPELQEKYCADPKAEMCPCYNIGDEFIFERDEERPFLAWRFEYTRQNIR